MQQYGLPCKQECLTVKKMGKKSSLFVSCQIRNFTQEKKVLWWTHLFNLGPFLFVFQWYLFLFSSLFHLVIETHPTPSFLSPHYFLTSFAADILIVRLLCFFVKFKSTMKLMNSKSMFHTALMSVLFKSFGQSGVQISVCTLFPTVE